jgi:polysaccharide transporter, PST family
MPDLQQGLGAAAARGVAITGAGQGAKMLIQVGGTVVLARLLAPEDYGLMAMIAVAVGLADVLRDFGLSGAAIQARSFLPSQRDNLFWLNVAIGGSCALAFAALSQPIAAFYDEPRLAPIALTWSVIFLFSGIGAQFSASMSRSLKFGRLAILEVGSQTVGLTVGVSLALSGAGVWALVFQQLAQGLTFVVLGVALSGWLPGWWHRDADIKPFLRFGGSLFATQLLTYASKNVDSMLIGLRSGPVALGLYDRAFQLLMWPLMQMNAPATKVALPVLSRLQDDRERFYDFLLRAQQILVTAVVLALAFISAQADSLIPLVLGEQWRESVPIFRILAVAGAFQALDYATYWIFLSKGLMGSNLRWALISRPAVICGLLLGSIWGVNGVAWAYSIGLMILWPGGLLWVSRVSDAPVLRMFKNGLGILALCVAAGCSSFVLAKLAVPGGGIFAVVVGFLGLMAAAAVLVAGIPRARENFVAALSVAKFLKVSRTSG